ncbi:MAG TPA: carboxylesterase family protein, partial [Povalibacter sp.]
MLLIRCSLLLSILLTGQSGWASTTIAPSVQISDGILEGVATPGLVMFRGIPFAAPPVGTLRWREPQPVKPWSGVRKADAFASRCMQRPVFSDMVFRSNGTSEDCLYLNVWTATTDASARQPVLVYFYGGAFIAGDGSEYRYDGA